MITTESFINKQKNKECKMSDLDTLLRSGKMSRREMLALLGKTGIGMATGGSIITACKNPTTPPDPSTKINLRIEYRNATEGTITEETLTDITSGSTIIIDYNKIAGKQFSEVDMNRITVRDSVSGIGNLVTHSTNGIATFNAPYKSTEYAAYFYSKKNGANYEIIDADGFRTAGSQIVMGTRYMRVHPENRDGQTCPEGVYFGSIGGYRGALDQLNDAMITQFAKWGSINSVTSGGNFGAGAGNCSGGDGEHLPTADWIGVNYNKLGNNPMGLVSIALEEGFEVICDVDNIGGSPSGRAILDIGGILSPRGRDLFVYTLVKDKLGDK